jgi:uncharacterized membrane protein
MLPPLPPWDGIHPLIVHFPIALLLVAPLFILLAILAPRHAAGFSLSALILLALGSIGAIVAVESGEAGAQLAERTPEINKVIARHQDLAEWVRLLFSVLTVVWAGVLVVPKLLKRPLQRVPRLVVSIVFLAMCLAASLVLINTGHLGARLVHEFGVRALFAP